MVERRRYRGLAREELDLQRTEVRVPAGELEEEQRTCRDGEAELEQCPKPRGRRRGRGSGDVKEEEGRRCQNPERPVRKKGGKQRERPDLWIELDKREWRFLTEGHPAPVPGRLQTQAPPRLRRVSERDARI